MKPRIGILLINLGTPDATSYWPVRRYLKEFLSDRRVVEASGPVWWAVLNGIILTRRPHKTGRAYRKIWNHDRDESPLRTITRAQAEKVAGHFDGQEDILVDWAMRYGSPAIGERIEQLLARGCTRILLFPLYPQYSAATTATAMDKVYEALMRIRHQPELRSVRPYYDNPAYIRALADSMRARRRMLPWEPEVIIASMHGLPVDFIEKGDPYQSHAERTVELLRSEMGLSETELLLTYQSRSGRAVWLEPDTEETLGELADNGVRKVMVVTPGFAADCIETLEEIEIRAADVFRQNGGQEFSMVPCLNDGKASVAMLVELIERELVGWH